MNNSPYADDSSLNQLQVNHASRVQLGPSLAPMETDALPQPQDQPVADDMEIDAARQRGDGDRAYADDAGLNEFQVNEVSQTSTPSPHPSMETDDTSQLSKQPVGENMGSDVAQQLDKRPDNVSQQSIPTDTAQPTRSPFHPIVSRQAG